MARLARAAAPIQARDISQPHSTSRASASSRRSPSTSALCACRAAARAASPSSLSLASRASPSASSTRSGTLSRANRPAAGSGLPPPPPLSPPPLRPPKGRASPPSEWCRCGGALVGAARCSSASPSAPSPPAQIGSAAGVPARVCRMSASKRRGRQRDAAEAYSRSTECESRRMSTSMRFRTDSPPSEAAEAAAAGDGAGTARRAKSRVQWSETPFSSS
mmetsp:Transcript_17718/g.58643  ORF Transcript_17718/g.58643 Transcript_17718/m.58643 type:complete len:220 (-) Transcript_17718:148-807(-)